MDCSFLNDSNTLFCIDEFFRRNLLRVEDLQCWQLGENSVAVIYIVVVISTKHVARTARVLQQAQMFHVGKVHFDLLDKVLQVFKGVIVQRKQFYMLERRFDA